MAGRRRRGGSSHGEEGGGSERWLLTYADMITLLLALFILLFAMSTIDIVRFEAVKRELSETFSGQVFNSNQYVVDGAQNVLEPENNQPVVQQQLELVREGREAEQKEVQKVVQEVKEQIKKENLDDKVELVTNERGIAIRLAGDAFFASGSAEITPGMQALLRKLVVKLSHDRSHRFAVEGHTDGAPIATAQFPSNWELSGARALAVAYYLMDAGVAPTRVSYAGFADTRPVSRPPANDKEKSIARNRRVEIVLLTAEGYEALEKALKQSGVSSGRPPQVGDTAPTTSRSGDGITRFDSGAFGSDPGVAPGEIDVVGSIIDLSGGAS